MTDWNAAAPTYDKEVDHGLRDPQVRERWRALLRRYLPDPPGRIADIGCGTGTLTALLAEDGYAVHGLDSSPRMLALARAKVRSDAVTFRLGDAADPDLAPGAFDAVVCRHVLWQLADPEAVLGRWLRLLAPGGCVLLVEGRWGLGDEAGGIYAAQAQAMLEAHRAEVTVEMLTDADYWGREVDDERYVVFSPA